MKTTTLTAALSAIGLAPLTLGATSTPDPAAIAKAEGAAFKQAFDGMPKCAQFCIKNNTAQVGCNMTDLACQCSHLRPLIVEVAPCMIKEGCEMEQMMQVGSTVLTLCVDFYNKTHNGSLPPMSEILAAEAAASKKKTSAGSRVYAGGWVLVAGAVALAVSAL